MEMIDVVFVACDTASKKKQLLSHSFRSNFKNNIKIVYLVSGLQTRVGATGLLESLFTERSQSHKISSSSSSTFDKNKL